jgi:hypothetical protein
VDLYTLCVDDVVAITRSATRPQRPRGPTVSNRRWPRRSRRSAGCAVAFDFNGFEVVATADEVVRAMVALAAREIGLEELAAFLADHVTDPIGTGD